MKLARALCLLLVVGAAATVGSCGEDEVRPVDFYVTVQLKPTFSLDAVDRLELVFQADYNVHLGESEGSDFDGDITWLAQQGSSGDEFVVNMSGNYFRRFAFEVDRDTWEIDVPFFGGQQPAQFGVQALAFWEDPDGVERQVGIGSGGVFTLPVEDRRTPVVIELRCLDGWEYTCLTGCAAGSSACTEQEGCGTAGESCVDGCCTAG